MQKILKVFFGHVVPPAGQLQNLKSGLLLILDFPDKPIKISVNNLQLISRNKAKSFENRPVYALIFCHLLKIFRGC